MFAGNAERCIGAGELIFFFEGGGEGSDRLTGGF